MTVATTPIPAVPRIAQRARHGGFVLASLALVFCCVNCGESSTSLLGGAGASIRGPGALGGPCTTDRDCKPSSARCLTGKKYPGGMCSVGCGDEARCPAGTSCIEAPESDGTYCLVDCDPGDSEDDCSTGSGCRAGYCCEKKNEYELELKTYVCLN